ncbi:SDR family NAD(P)-dependent oxidoreductase [Rhodococcus chondri]|uniref:SDR family NAD(P)-dependent oxidoreductase n=1 Tax=Rhodococcus chondri TaxID=3065941 RepID=A0ABU7JPL0_9NOCA|nr:SDR family NAD(P)-dependent oxidoreductase [Rhodococcus sp. CC-R104]MEE2031969.1 SDR family NAD(P)-dependent oxidoreductase [Rhodococcus sp. CC-R104]
MTEARPVALVTGASRGIGLELAKLFAADGYDLVIAADSDAIESATAELRRCGGAVVPVRADLRTAAGVDSVYSAVTADGRTLAAAALNAGVGSGGAFVETDLEDTLSIVDLNVRSTVHLAKLVLTDMVRADAGRLLLTSSVVSKMPGPYQAVYNASKAFVQSFAEGLQGELTGSRVTVTSLLPGATDTRFFERAHMLDTVLGQGPKDDPAAVAKDGYEALMRGDRKVVASSLLAKAMAAANAVTPDVVKAAAHRVVARPGSGR